MWAASHLNKRTVLDAGCGVGYGSYILATVADCTVLAFDVDREAIDYAIEHYKHELITYQRLDIDWFLPRTDDGIEAYATVAFEVIEHLKDPSFFLEHTPGLTLFGSVPNEDVDPFDPKWPMHHFRHYRENEIADLLKSCGWTVVNFWNQQGKYRQAAHLYPGTDNYF